MKKLSLLAVVLVAIAACGDDDADTVPPPDGPATIDVQLTEFLFSPATFTVGAGAQVTVNATNDGQDSHTFTVLGADVEVSSAAEVDPAQVIADINLSSGQSD